MSSSGEQLCAGTRKDGSVCAGHAWANGYCRAHQSQAPDETAGESEQRSVLPGRFREELAEDLAADYSSVHEVLRSAMSAEASQWLECDHCHRKTSVKTADTRARLDAIKLWSELGYGRAATAPGSAQPAKLADLDLGRGLAAMSDVELEAYLLSVYLSDPDALQEERERREVIFAAIARGELPEAAAVRAAEQIGVSHARIAEALGLAEAPPAA